MAEGSGAIVTPCDLPLRRLMQVIQDADGLMALLTKRREANFRLELSQLDSKEHEVWQTRLHRRAKECGCSAGALAAALTLTSGAGAILWLWIMQGRWPGALHVLLACAAITIATGIGKGLGLALAEREWRRDLVELAGLVSKRSVRKPYACVPP